MTIPDKETAIFWKKVSGWLFAILCALISFISGVTLTATSTILSYYKDAPMIDRRLADLEDRVDRNDAKWEGHYNHRWENELQEKRENYTPMLEAAKR